MQKSCPASAGGGEAGGKQRAGKNKKARSLSTAGLTDCLAGVVGFEPTNVGFRIRCLNRTWRYPSKSGAVGETRTLMALTTATSTLRVYQFRHDRENLLSSRYSCLKAPDVGPRLSSEGHPFRKGLAGVVGFEPTNVGFRIRCLNRTWRYPSKSGAVGETRTLMALTTATSTLRVYQFRHDRTFRFTPHLSMFRRTGSSAEEEHFSAEFDSWGPDSGFHYRPYPVLGMPAVPPCSERRRRAGKRAC